MKSKIIKEFIVVIITIGFIFILTTSFGIIPALGNFLNPFGVWTVPDSAEYPESLIIEDANLISQVQVKIDIYGVPHIHAENDEDLFFALGYMHSYNRLFEMDIFRKYASGKLSEFLGAEYIEIDKFYKLLGFYRAAEKELTDMQENHTRIYQLIQKYCSGVNKYISDFSTKLPLEYHLLSVKPEPWKPIDVLIFRYLQAWELAPSTYDLDFTLLKKKLPDNVFDELYPNWTVGLPFEDPIIPNIKSNSPKNFKNTIVNTIVGISSFIREIPTILGPIEQGIGSNNWVVNGSKSSTGSPILCGDPHLAHQIPSIWFEAHLISNENNGGLKYETHGVGFPGVPFLVIGHNAHIAWTLTNTGGDSIVDYYNETVNDTHYYYNSEWNPLKIFEIPIDIKGGKKVYFTVKETCHGPLISDLLDNSYFNEYPHNDISIKILSNNLPRNGRYCAYKTLYGINRACNYSVYNESLSFWDSPAQNFVFADKNGDIAMNIAGAFPIRKKGVSGAPDGNLTGRFVQPGNGTGEEWAGFIPYSELPQILNPSQGYLASANQRPINGSYPYYLGTNSWSNGYRARRINDVLRNKDKFSVNDMKSLQAENYDYSVSQFLPILIETWNYSINAGETFSSEVRRAMNELYEWNLSEQRFIMNRSLIAPTIYWKWIELFEYNTWSDEFADWSVSGLKLPDIKILEYVTKFERDSKWFNDTRVAGTQDRNHTLIKSLNDTVDWLKINLNSDINKWKWNSAHKVFFQHLSLIESLNRGPYPHDGSNWAINNAGGIWDPIEKAYIVQFGPSWRMVVNLGNFSSPVESWGVYPGGQNSNPLSSHYDDLLGLWLNYQYHDIYFSSQPEEIVESNFLFRK
ncbi:MAG: hypothetical protein GF329_16460 [Candidatus Lokiarchaeota archaeon]|nr:hypothetical protein [Candidatus Lokiarchaeota archaeon]